MFIAHVIFAILEGKRMESIILKTTETLSYRKKTHYCEIEVQVLGLLSHYGGISVLFRKNPPEGDCGTDFGHPVTQRQDSCALHFL